MKRATITRSAVAKTPRFSRLYSALLPALGLAICAGTGSVLANTATTKASVVSEAKKMQIDQSFGKVQLTFEPNRGQSADVVKFISRSNGYNLYFTDKDATIAIGDSEGKVHSVRVGLDGSEGAKSLTPENPTGGHSSYLNGKDKTGALKAIPHYKQIRYDDVYAGIDLIYYGNPNKLQYDFQVAPGADPSKIA